MSVNGTIHSRSDGESYPAIPAAIASKFRIIILHQMTEKHKNLSFGWSAQSDYLQEGKGLENGKYARVIQKSLHYKLLMNIADLKINEIANIVGFHNGS
jgi:hypothetical protein